MKKRGPVALAILLCLSIVFATGWRKAMAQSRLESRIVSTHEKILELREQKMNDCALIDSFPVSLAGICF